MRMPAGLKKRHLLYLLVGALLLPQVVLAGNIDPDDPPQGLFADEWMLALIGGQRAGYAHTTMSRADDQITTRVISALSIARGQATLEISMMESSTETVAGQPLSFETFMKAAAVTTSTRGRIHDGQVEIERTQFGMTQTERVSYPTGALMAWGMYAEQLRRGFDEGLSYEIDTYVPSMRTDVAVKTAVTVGGRETIDLLGERVEGTRVTTNMSTPAGAVEVASWVNQEGETLKSQIQMMGLAMELIRTNKDTATRDTPPPELFVSNLVKIDRKIDRSAARRVRYRLRVTGQRDPVPDLPTTGMQKPGRRTEDSIELEVTRQDHTALQDAKLTAPGSDLGQYLEANIWINSDDPEVIAMAKTAAGDAKTPYQIADSLRRYVTGVIKEKNLNVGFASASEVCRNKEGDCTEHAVLLAALGRVHRIPSRVVMGLVYVPRFAGTANAFGFHMWTQFHLGGRWVDFDAAHRESVCNPTHIAIATSSLKSSSLADMAFGLIKIIGHLEIDVVSADPPQAVSAR